MSILIGVVVAVLCLFIIFTIGWLCGYYAGLTDKADEEFGFTPDELIRCIGDNCVITGNEVELNIKKNK